MVKISELSDNQWRRLDPRVPLVPVDTPAVKDLAETTEWMADPDFRVFRVLRVHRAKLRQQLTWTPFRPSLPKETKLEAEPLESDSFRLKWVPWAHADPRALRVPQDLSDSSDLVVTPEIRDRSDSVDPPELLDPAVLPERRVNLDVMVNLEPRALPDQWESADHQECQDFQAPRDTGVCPELMVLREPKDNRASTEI